MPWGRGATSDHEKSDAEIGDVETGDEGAEEDGGDVEGENEKGGLRRRVKLGGVECGSLRNEEGGNE